MWYFILIGLAIAILLVQNQIQKKRYKRGIVPNKSKLLCRSRWAIVLAGIGVISYIIPIREFQLKYRAQEIEDALRLDTSEIKRCETIPVRYFQEGLYLRKDLDVLEADYRELGSWMDDNSAKLHENMKAYNIIEVDSLSIPVPKSVIGEGDLPYYRESFLNAINKYNQDAKKYSNVQRKISAINVLSMIFNYLMPIVIIIAMALQLNVVFWNCHEKEKNNNYQG